MNRILALFALSLAILKLQAQAPQKLNYQAVVRNASNAVIQNTTVGVRVSILQGAVNGPEV